MLSPVGSQNPRQLSAHTSLHAIFFRELTACKLMTFFLVSELMRVQGKLDHRERTAGVSRKKIRPGSLYRYRFLFARGHHGGCRLCPHFYPLARTLRTLRTLRDRYSRYARYARYEDSIRRSVRRVRYLRFPSCSSECPLSVS